MFGSWEIIPPTSTNQGFAYSPAMGGLVWSSKDDGPRRTLWKVAAAFQPAGCLGLNIWYLQFQRILIIGHFTSPIDPKLPKPYAPKSLLWIRNRWLWGWGLVLLSWLYYAIGLWIPNFQVTQAQHRRCPPVPATGRSCSQTKRQKPEAYDAFFEATLMSPPIFGWLVVWTPLKNISQLGWLFPICGKIKNVPNHQPVGNEDQGKRLKKNTLSGVCQKKKRKTCFIMTHGKFRKNTLF